MVNTHVSTDTGFGRMPAGSAQTARNALFKLDAKQAFRRAATGYEHYACDAPPASRIIG
jgi:hypothetical protein